MVRVTLLRGLGKQWLEFEQWHWQQDGPQWRSIGRSMLDEPGVEEMSAEEMLTLLEARLAVWLDDVYSEGPGERLPL
jgi:hypothetical protein